MLLPTGHSSFQLMKPWTVLFTRKYRIQRDDTNPAAEVNNIQCAAFPLKNPWGPAKKLSSVSLPLFTAAPVAEDRIFWGPSD